MKKLKPIQNKDKNNMKIINKDELVIDNFKFSQFSGSIVTISNCCNEVYFITPKPIISGTGRSQDKF